MSDMDADRDFKSTAVQLEFIALCRINTRLTCALIDAAAQVEATFAHVPDWRRPELEALLERINRALEESKPSPPHRKEMDNG